MTEANGTSPSEYDVIESQLDDARQQESNLHRAMRMQFAASWQQDPARTDLHITASLGESPGVVLLEPEEGHPFAEGGVDIRVEVPTVGDPVVTYGLDDGSAQITSLAAADRLAVSMSAMAAASDAAVGLVLEDINQHRALQNLQDHVAQLENTLETLRREENYDPDLDPEVLEERRQDPTLNDGTLTYETALANGLAEPEQQADLTPEWATNSQDESITPARVASDWIQSTTMIRTYLESDRPDLAREWIEMLDENLAGFADGEAPPGSDESFDVYHDAVARAAIPYGQPPITPDEVREQLGNTGMRVPEFDVASIQKSTGIMPLDRGVVTRELEQESKPPAGLEDVAAARLSVRRAIASITEDSETAQTHLTAANGALTQAVDALRPDQTHAGVLAAQESVQQASEKVAAVAETAAKVDVEVSVCTIDNCPGCFATKRALDKAGVEYDEISLEEHPDLVQRFKKQLNKEGQKVTAPFVQTKDGDLWAGYNPAKLREHGLDHRTRQQRSGETGRDTEHGR